MSSSVARLVTAWSLAHFGYRAAVIALPLLALQETGSAWTVGLVAGAAGIPTITAPWWTRGWQQRFTSARALGGLLAAEGLATLVVPGVALAGTLTPAVMAASGLSVGVFNALSGPLDSALLAAVGDRRDRDHGAARLLALQETAVRVVMTAAPLATLPLIGWAGAAPVVALEGVLSLAGAALVVGLRMEAHPAGDTAPRVSALLRAHREIRIGWTVRGAGCAAWFAFTLGLAVLGQERGQGALLATVGLTAYSAGAVLGSTGGVRAACSPHPAVLNSASWCVAGMGWIAMSARPTVAVIAVASALMGLVVPAGNAATTAMVTRATRGAGRRSALTAQATVVVGSSTLGSLVGGPVIAVLGPRPAIAASGTAVAVVALASLAGSLRGSRGERGEPGGQRDQEVRVVTRSQSPTRAARAGMSGSVSSSDRAASAR